MNEMKCIKAEIYYENGVPFVDWYGTTVFNNKVIQVHIPKISLYFNYIENKTEIEHDLMSGKIKYLKQIYAVREFDEDKFFTITIE